MGSIKGVVPGFKGFWHPRNPGYIWRMTHDAFTLHLPPHRTTPVVFSSPHSGADYPQSFVSQSLLDPRMIRSSEDAFVDRLFSAAPRFGAPLIAARIPRAYIDLNRAADELDPAVIEGIDRRRITPVSPPASV